MSLGNARVVLVRPQIAANLGAAARVMRNMGLVDLVLVATAADPADREARKLSTHGEAILDGARQVASLDEAVADCGLIAATSARTGGRFRQQSLGPPQEVMPRLVEALAHGRIALVFGPEATGLTNEEVTRCHWLIHIPTDEGYPALNLAQAVAICLYELRGAWRRRAGLETVNDPPAPMAEQERMFAQLRDALERIHFLYGPKADSLMHGLRHLIGRAQPTTMEIKLLLGLARQIRWFAAEQAGKDLSPETQETYRLGLEALRERLGPEGMIRFLQHFDLGHGDYARERHAWVDQLNLEDIRKLSAAGKPGKKRRKK